MTTEAHISASIKTQNGSILTVRGDNQAEFSASLDALGKELSRVLNAESLILTGAAVAAVQTAIPEATLEPAITGYNPITGEPVYGTPAVSAAPPARPVATRTVTDKYGNLFTFGHPEAETHVCKHGPRVHKSGRSKAGKPYAAWVCKEDAPGGNYKLKCDVEWAS